MSRRYFQMLSVLLLAAGLQACTGDAGPTSPTPALGAISEVYADLDDWLCHPQLDAENDACMGALDTRVVAADGTAVIETVALDPAFEVDCFYVYPTTSADPGANADRMPDVQERQTTLLQAGRYRDTCRMFAPVYRQRSLTALAVSGRTDAVYSPEDIEAANEVAYGDVREAFLHYIATASEGRGFVLIGHSQGARLLARLIAEEVETTPALAARLVAAHIPGTTLAQPLGADVGGSFRSTPVCRHATQTGCVVAYASYRAGDPALADPRFGRVTEPGMQAICVHPAALSGGPAGLQARLPFVLPPVFQALLRPRGSGGPYANRAENVAAMVETPFFAVPGQIDGACRVHPDSGAHYLEVRIAADPEDPRADDYPGEFFGGDNWGLHLADVNLAQADLVALARSQARQYLAQRAK
ncbi:MAG: DUF3089 domain-containing protein [Abyssibacter sp.]|uniref:DUF3089 domain-containing protein n=1 Tax=Abyssibacter sp. TaxID=2320200 RepID=UPI00321AD806